MRRKNKQEQQPSTSGMNRITPVDIQQAEFRLAFRGYNERDVDTFLDRVTEDLSSYLEENQRLQAAPGVVRVPDREATDEAADIVARAREEAAAILRRAEDEAAAIRATAGTGTSGDARSAVGPFLNREREFLHGLGSLVQSHAEEIKGMVLALRARAEAAPSERSPASEVRMDAGAEADAGTTAGSRLEGPSATLEPASSGEIRSRMGFETETVSVPDEAAGDDTVVVDTGTDPVYTTEGSPASDRRERSLRELFWGEE